MDKVINAYHTLVKKTKVRRYVFHNDKRQAEIKRTKQIENDSEDDWVLDFDMDKVINAYRTFEKSKSWLGKFVEDTEVFVPPPQQLKESKVLRHVFHNDKRQAKAKEDLFVPPPEQLKETKVVINAYLNFENQKPGIDKSLEEKEVFVPPPE